MNPPMKNMVRMMLVRDPYFLLKFKAIESEPISSHFNNVRRIVTIYSSFGVSEAVSKGGSLSYLSST
jgi:hypothetical protein